jgi:hypothetical protein
VRLLEAAWEEPRLRLARAIELVEYHIRRNKVAKASHDKTWRQKHKKVESPWCPTRVALRVVLAIP